jgi:general stress protein 26
MNPPVRRLAALVDSIPVAMLTTIAGDRLHTRPMRLETVEASGALVFLTHLSSEKADEIAEDPRVNVSLIGAKPERYVSVSGIASVMRDRRRIARLWRPTYRAWFPGGRSDPELAVLRVDVRQFEYWVVPSSKLVRLWCAARAVIGGRPVEAGVHRSFSVA